MPLYLAIKPRATKFCLYIVALSSGPSPRGVNYNPRVEMIAKGDNFYLGLYGEIFRNLLVAKRKYYVYQFRSMLGVLCFKPIPTWSDTGPSWPSCFVCIYFNICKCFQSDKSKNLVFGKELIHFYST